MKKTQLLFIELCMLLLLKKLLNFKKTFTDVCLLLKLGQTNPNSTLLLRQNGMNFELTCPYDQRLNIINKTTGTSKLQVKKKS